MLVHTQGKLSADSNHWSSKLKHITLIELGTPTWRSRSRCPCCFTEVHFLRRHFQGTLILFWRIDFILQVNKVRDGGLPYHTSNCGVPLRMLLRHLLHFNVG
ncbi:hypothetical protein TRVL_04410 [Trypanosoma vivax]|nr:hypothetical protein TRVL_04410 [Trypanosoma vivax]